MKKGGDFSLLELIICLAIFSILMAISAPNFYTMRKNAQQKDAARSIMLAFVIWAVRSKCLVRLYAFTD